MTDYLLAAGNDPARTAGALLGTFLIPIIGLILLIVGLTTRSKSRRQIQQPYGGPPNFQQPYPGAPPQYAQQAYGQPQYGQQPYPQPPYPAPARKPQGAPLIIIGAVLLVLGLLVVVGRLGTSASNNMTNSGSGLTVGECLSVSSFRAADPNADPTPCGSTDGVYELAAKVDRGVTCPDGKSETTSSYSVLKSSRSTLCFALNLQKGECYRIDKATLTFEPVSCSSTVAGVVQVGKRVDGATDLEKTCGPGGGGQGVAFPTPPRVICVSAPE